MPANVVNDQDRVPAPEPLLGLIERAVESVLQQEGHGSSQVDVTLVDDEAIQGLNSQYRGVDRPTDVLSFALQEEAGEGEPAVTGGPQDTLLGDVVISLPRAVQQAEEYGHGLEREASFLAVHGTLHLLGYDHGTPQEEADMMRRTEEALTPLGLGRGDASRP